MYLYQAYSPGLSKVAIDESARIQHDRRCSGQSAQQAGPNGVVSALLPKKGWQTPAAPRYSRNQEHDDRIFTDMGARTITG